jgi:hypothetical protein
MLVCSLCGSDEVVYDAWVNVNDYEDVQIFDDVYCKGCEQTTHLITEEEFNDSKR